MMHRLRYDGRPAGEASGGDDAWKREGAESSVVVTRVRLVVEIFLVSLFCIFRYYLINNI